MLRIDKTVAIPGVSGVTAYGDDQLDYKFYVLADGPRFRMEDGLPVFKFIKYRFPIDRADGKKGGGFCFFDVEFVVPEDKMTAVIDYLQQLVNAEYAKKGRQAPQVEIGTINWMKGSAKITIEESDGTLVQKVWSSGKPSLVGRNICTFAIELTPEGATLFEQALQGKGGVVSVYYDLFTQTKLPPVNIRGYFYADKFYSFYQNVDIEWHLWSEDSYSETIREQFRDSSFYSLDFDWGGLTDTKIQSQIRDWATRTMEDQIEKKMIEAIAPVTEEGRQVPDGIENLTRDLSVHKIASFSLNFRENMSMEWNPAPKGYLPNITSLKGPDGKPLVWSDFAQEVDLDDPFFRQLHVAIQVNADFDRIPIHSVEVHLDYPKTGAHSIEEFRFSNADDIQKFSTYIENDNWKYKCWYQVNYKGASQTYKSPEIETDEKVLTINVDDLGFLSIDVQSGDLNFDQVARVQVSMQYEDKANGVEVIERQFTLDRDNREFKFEKLIFQPRRNPYKYQVKYFMADGKEYETGWRTGQATMLYINDPFSATKTVGIRAFGNLDSRIDTIFIDLLYTDPTNDYRQSRSVALSKNNPFVDWTFPVINEGSGTVIYSGTVRLANGNILEIKETETNKNTIMVGLPMLEVQIIPDLIDFEQAKLVKVSLHYEDPVNGISENQDVIFRKGQLTPFNWQLEIIDKNQAQYQWQATFYLNDGIQRKTPLTATDEETIILEIPALPA